MRAGILWSGIEAGLAGLLSLASAVIIARWIGPEAVGLSAAVIAPHVVLWVLANGLFADALVQRAEVDDHVASSAFWAGLALGVAAALIQVVIGMGLAWLFDEPGLAPMALALAASLPLVGMAGVAQGLLTRRLAYRALMLRTAVGQGLGVAVGVALAAAGGAAWAPVAQQAVGTGLGAIVLLFGARWRPRDPPRVEDLRALLRVGLPLIASTLTQIARFRIFAVLLGAIAGPAVLGQTHMAFRLIDSLRDLVFTALWRLFLPDLARFQHDPAAMLARVDRLMVGCALTVLPFCAVLALLVSPVATWFLGSVWGEAGAASVPLIGVMAVMTLTFPAGVALIALGQARYTLYGNLAALGLCIVAVLALRPQTSWTAVLIWSGSQLLVVPYALWVNGRALGVGMVRPVRAGLGAGAVAVASVALGVTIAG
jgi:PST family polysaccharide transporter